MSIKIYATCRPCNEADRVSCLEVGFIDPQTLHRLLSRKPALPPRRPGIENAMSINNGVGAPGTIRTSDPQIRSLTSRVDKTTIFCKRVPLSSMGDQWVSTHIANHFAVCQRDDGMWSLGFHDDAPGPFPSRNFAESVRLRQTRHYPKWCLQ